ncbi:MAG: DUF6518 family protein [Chloroflexota bacterium]
MRGNLYGLVALLAAVAGYYTMMQFVEFSRAADLGSGALRSYFLRVIAIWLAVALALGPVFGAAGAIWRGGRASHRRMAVTLLGGALSGEAIAAYLYGWRTGLYLITILALSASFPWLLLREGERRWHALGTIAIASVLLAQAWHALILGVRMLAN